MEVSRRYWTTMGLAVLLGCWGIIVAQPGTLIGAVGILSWLLARQYRFIRAVSGVVDGLMVELAVDRTVVTAEETTVGTLRAQIPEPTDLSVTVSTNAPAATTTEVPACKITPGDRESEVPFTVTWPIAGTHRFDQPTATITDSLGLFSQAIPQGEAPSVRVEPRAPRDIHVGEGGDQIAAGFGEHGAEHGGSGLTPAEVRQYVPGDSMTRIDWKATARLDDPHVREFESETDLETLLIVDHRTPMEGGPDGETKLDFARQVALAFVDTAQELGDPLGLTGVGDDGHTHVMLPSTDRQHYRTINRRLRELTVTQESPNTPSESITPARARFMAAHLDGETNFDRRLRPFFSDTEQYVRRIGKDPLFEAARVAKTRSDGTIRTIIFTDDSKRVELREAVKVAQRGHGQVIVFLTPTALYTSPSVRDLDETYREYAEFEAFRRDLAGLDRVSAFEVGPSDQLSTVLAAGQRNRRTQP